VTAVVPIAVVEGYPAALRAAQDDEYWAENTRHYVDRARGVRSVELRDELADYVHWMEVLATVAARVEPALLTAYVTEFARLVNNLGQPRDVDGSVITALDRAAALPDLDGDVVSALHLARDAYYRTLNTDSAERFTSITAAVTSASDGSDQWARAMARLSWYHIDTSRYSQALREAKRLRRGFGDEVPDVHRCAVLTLSGVALYTSLRNLRQAAKHLTTAAAMPNPTGDVDMTEWISTARHYLGRIAETEGRFDRALALYLDALRLRETGLEDVLSTGFAHLRIAEPLIASGLLPAARDHLDEASRQIETASNFSAAMLQRDLGYAAWDAARGDDTAAEQTVLDALDRARRMGFWRGELLCLGYLLSLYVRRRALIRLPWLALRIAGTIRGGELGRGNAIRLLAKVPIAVRIAVRRISGPRRASTTDVYPTHCPCPLHTDRPPAPSTP
jgi:tetratricopeptide (TPR) repeat protein